MEIRKGIDAIPLIFPFTQGGEHLTRLAELVNQGAIKPQVDKVFSLDQAKDAFAYFENGSPNGKVVLKIK